MVRKARPVKGSISGLLTVLGDAPKGPSGLRMIKVRCECGNERAVQRARFWDYKSCGCLRGGGNSLSSFEGKAASYHWLYNKLYNLIYRCENPKSNNYGTYGARGIRVCPEWRNNPLAFMNWAKKQGLQQGSVLVRVDKKKGYSPDNCYVRLKR